MENIASSSDMSTPEVGRILSNPNDRDELMSAINHLDIKWKETMELWKPVSNVITLQNEMIERFFPAESKLLKPNEGNNYQIHYVISGQVRGKDKR